jgi:HEAT repeat protein
MKIRKKTVILAVAGLAMLLAVIFAVPTWRRAVFGLHRNEASYLGKPTSYWREEIRRLYRSPPNNSPLGKIMQRVGVAEDTNDFIFRHRYRPLTIPGPVFKRPPPDPNKLAVVLELIEDDDPDIRSYAARFLGEFVTWDEAVTAAKRLLDDPDGNVRLAAIDSLAEIGLAARGGVCFLAAVVAAPEAATARLLIDPDAGVRLATIDSLAKIAPAARAAVPKLTELLHDTTEEYHIRAARALWRIDQQPALVVPVLAKALRCQDSLHRQRAMDVLCEMRSEAEGAFAELCATSRDGDHFARLYALRTLGTFGRRSLPALTAGLSDPVAVVRGWAIEALEEIGPDAAPAVPALARILVRDPEKHVRDSAAKALARIAPKPK